MDIVRTLATSVLFAIVLSEENAVQKRAGMLGQSVKLPCGIPRSQPPVVRWEDTVHTSTPDPIMIFQSRNNPSFSINADHPNAANFKVDNNNFHLKISKLTVDDVGAYTCISQNGPTTIKQEHYLLIYGNFGCTGGETQLNEGDRLSVNCEVKYSGDQPSIDWFLDDQQMDSIDRSDIIDAPIAGKELDLNATHDLDGKTLRCRMRVADREEECNRVLNIAYPVRDVAFNGGRETFYAGEEVTCTARGNPLPVISLVPTSLPEEVEDRQKSSIIIPRGWVGRDVTLECTARNTYEGEERVMQNSKVIHILEPTTTTPAPTTTKAPTTKATTMKIKEPVKPVVDDNNSSGQGPCSWKCLPLVLLSMTLMKLIVF